MCEHKYKYTINFTNVKHYSEIHFRIFQGLDFPDYYGCNWDAFWDCLTDMAGRSLYIEIIGFDVIEQNFDNAAKTMIDILREFKHYEDDKFVDDIIIEIVNGDSRVNII